MTTISGDDVAYALPLTVIDIVGDLIIRDAITADSTDDFTFTANAFLIATIGFDLIDYVGYSYTFTIQNSSVFNISQNATGLGLTMAPTAAGVLIPPNGSQTFNFIQTGVGTISIDVVQDRKVMGPATATTDTHIPVFSGTTGNLIQETGVAIDSIDNVTGATTVQIGTTGLVKFQASAAGDWDLTLPPDAGTANYHLETDGTGVTTWAPSSSSRPLMYIYGPTATMAVTAVYQTVLLDTSPIIDTGFSVLAGIINIDDVGLYEISYWAQFETTDRAGGARASYSSKLVLDSSTDVAGSTTECYIREQNGNIVRPGSGKTVLVDVTLANTTIELQIARVIGTTTGDVSIDKSSVVIRQVR